MWHFWCIGQYCIKVYFTPKLGCPQLPTDKDNAVKEAAKRQWKEKAMAPLDRKKDTDVAVEKLLSGQDVQLKAKQPGTELLKTSPAISCWEVQADQQWPKCFFGRWKSQYRASQRSNSRCTSKPVAEETGIQTYNIKVARGKPCKQGEDGSA
ncbi:hypothetical protein R1flu_020062 [Riccia fluitans]|uniref:Uncharacterized protein n=1 Tax=Riccia fluitans TaxID=41844 RepID=A0ABD1ZP94_9MARC